MVSGSYSVASIGAALICCFVRGPWEDGWVGWKGGWDPWKKSKNSVDGRTEEKVTLGGEEHARVSDVEMGEKHQRLVNEKADAENAVQLLGAEEGENPLRETRDHEEYVLSGTLDTGPEKITHAH